MLGKDDKRMKNLHPAQIALRKKASPQRARTSMRFFKTGPGEYGEGDVFIGVTVPDTRRVCKEFSNLKQREILNILTSKIHEDRLLGLLIIVENYSRSKDWASKVDWLNFYLSNRKAVNNWDLVDVTAYKILGDFCFSAEDDSQIWKLSNSNRHWDRRMAIIASFAYIRNSQTHLTFELANKFLGETEDLMHKATGWMLREAGKKNLKALKSFIAQNGNKMPRTMLRYAIERFPHTERRRILKQTS